jgi:hypothetical protein
MTRKVLALGIALAVNAAALATVDVAMLDGAARERVAQQEVERVVIFGDRPAEAFAAKNCPGHQTL